MAEKAKAKKKDLPINHYIDDYELTKLLMKEQAEFRNNERRQASEELSLKFLLILDHVLTLRNFSGYSRNWKDEFRSKSHELYVKHWHKFDPVRARLNFYQKDGELYLKEVEEFRGAFGWFSLFCKTGALDEIKKLKRRSAQIKEIIEGKNAELDGMETYQFN